MSDTPARPRKKAILSDGNSADPKPLLKQAVEQKRQQLVTMTTTFCQQHLDDEYAQLCAKLISKLARKRQVPFLSGRVDVWAASVVHALCQINFGFDRSQTPHTDATAIAHYFAVAKSTIASKAKLIRDMFKLDYGDDEFSTAKMRANNPYKEYSELMPQRMAQPPATKNVPGTNISMDEVMEVLNLSETQLAELTLYSPERGYYVNLDEEQHFKLLEYITQRNAAIEEHTVELAIEEIQAVLGLSDADIVACTVYSPELDRDVISLTTAQIDQLRAYKAQKQKPN